MTLFLVYLTGLALAAGVALVVVGYLRRPLRRILHDLCGTEDRAEFWTAFSSVTLVLVPVVGAMLHRPGHASDWDLVFEVAVQLRWALAGLIAATLVMGGIISRFIPRGGAVPAGGVAREESAVEAASGGGGESP